VPVIIASVVPGVLWGIFLWMQDRYEKEPVGKIILGYIGGVLSAFVVIYVSQWFPIPPEFSYLEVVLRAPVLEEAIKFLVAYLMFYRAKDFNEPVDGLIYAGTVALGFATFENIFYVAGANLQGPEAFWNVAGLRAILSVPAHMLFSTFWGYGMARRKFGLGGSKKGMVFLLVVAILSHAAFNALAILDMVWTIPFIGLMLGMWVYFFVQFNRMGKQSPFRDKGKEKG
jgi:RsiW-degrading membrane proteinase PrsW (M82 family)